MSSNPRTVVLLQPGNFSSCNRAENKCRYFLTDDPSLDLHHPIPVFTVQFGKQMNLETTESTELALQLTDLEIAFSFAWISTNRRFTCLVSQGFVDLVDQPGEGAAVDGLGEGIPGVGCLLQVQGTHQLQAAEDKSPQQPPKTPFSCLIITKQPLKSILLVAEPSPAQWQPRVRGEEGTAGRAGSFNALCLPKPQGLLLPPPLLLWSSCGSVHPEEQSHPLPAAAHRILN